MMSPFCDSPKYAHILDVQSDHACSTNTASPSTNGNPNDQDGVGSHRARVLARSLQFWPLQYSIAPCNLLLETVRAMLHGSHPELTHHHNSRSLQVSFLDHSTPLGMTFSRAWGIHEDDPRRWNCPPLRKRSGPLENAHSTSAAWCGSIGSSSGASAAYNRKGQPHRRRLEHRWCRVNTGPDSFLLGRAPHSLVGSPCLNGKRNHPNPRSSIPVDTASQGLMDMDLQQTFQEQIRPCQTVCWV